MDQLKQLKSTIFVNVCYFLQLNLEYEMEKAPDSLCGKTSVGNFKDII